VALYFVKALPVRRAKSELVRKQNNILTVGDVYQSNYVVSMATPNQEKLPEFIQGEERSGQRNPAPYLLSIFKSFCTSLLLLRRHLFPSFILF